MRRIARVFFAVVVMCLAVEVRAESAEMVGTLQIEQPQMVAFRGGNLNDFRTWVEAEVAKRAVATDKVGKVIINFKVMADGSVEVLDRPAMGAKADPELYAEVRRVVESSAGMWESAVQNGRRVNVSLVIPVNCDKVKTVKPMKKVKKEKRTEKKVQKVPALD